MKPRIAFHLVAIVVLTAAVAAAQSPKDASKAAQTTTPQGRESSAPSVSERDAATGMASGRRQHQPISITAREASSGMATGRRDAQDRESSQPSVSEAGVTTAREAGSGMATGRKSGSVIILDNDSTATAREAGSGMATGKSVSGDPHESLNSRNSAHATESLDAASKDAAKMSQAQSNPMYKGDGLQGSNPMFKGREKAAAPPSSNGSKPVEYKDGEDGTMHTRPATHKPTK